MGYSALNIQPWPLRQKRIALAQQYHMEDALV